jgi:hypothetical protein
MRAGVRGVRVNLDLSKKVGPFPLGVWGAIVGGGLLIGRYHKQQNVAALPAPSDAAAVDDGSLPPVPYDLGGSGGIIGGGGFGGGYYPPAPADLPPAPPPVSAPAAPSPSSPIPTQQAAMPAACTPPFPWHWVNGVLVDSVTGRPAFYGRQGQPGAPFAPGETLDSGWAAWQMPDGRWAKYIINGWNFLDPSRPPVCH